MTPKSRRGFLTALFVSCRHISAEDYCRVDRPKYLCHLNGLGARKKTEEITKKTDGRDVQGKALVPSPAAPSFLRTF